MSQIVSNYTRVEREDITKTLKTLIQQAIDSTKKELQTKTEWNNEIMFMLPRGGFHINLILKYPDIISKIEEEESIEIRFCDFRKKPKGLVDCDCISGCDACDIYCIIRPK